MFWDDCRTELRYPGYFEVEGVLAIEREARRLIEEDLFNRNEYTTDEKNLFNCVKMIVEVLTAVTPHRIM
jgi:hypothetical protein